MSLEELSEAELDRVISELERLKTFKETNLLEYTNWDFYEKQRDIRNEFLTYFTSGSGPRIVVLLGGNRPLAYGTKVKMADGSDKSIEDIKIGDGVLAYTSDGVRPCKVNDIPYDGEDRCYSIKTKTGKEVISSWDHCFDIKKGQNCTWKKLTAEEVSRLNSRPSIRLAGEMNLNQYDLGRKSVTPLQKCQRMDGIIDAVEDIGIRKTRCITIDHEDHKFVLSNGVVTYNTGKSETGASLVAEIFSNYPNMKIWCATESDMSIKTQQEKLHKWIPKHSIKDHDTYNYNPTRGWKNRIIVGKNKSTIWFKTYQQDRESFQGADLDLIVFDEEPPWDLFQEGLARLIDRNGMILFTFTALKGYTTLIKWIYEQKDNVKIHVLTLMDNPYLSQEARDNFIKNLDPDEVEARVYGKVKLLEGLVYKEFSRSKHIVEPFNYKELYDKDRQRFRIIDSIDPHTRTPHRWMRVFYDTKQDRAYVVDSLIAPIESQTISEFSKLIKAKYMGLKPDYTEIDTSSMAPLPIKVMGQDEPIRDDYTIRNEFHKSGITTILCIKDNDTGIRTVKERLHTFEEHGKVTKPRLYISSTCEDVIKEFELYQWESHVSSKTEARRGEYNKVRKKDDHFMDLIKYTCLRLNQYHGKDIKVTGPKFHK